MERKVKEGGGGGRHRYWAIFWARFDKGLEKFQCQSKWIFRFVGFWAGFENPLGYFVLESWEGCGRI